MKVTDQEFETLQMIFRLSRIGQPATSEICEKATSLVERGLVRRVGPDLQIPVEVQQELAANGRLLKSR